MKKAENQTNSNSKFPLAIIGLVLLAAVIGVLWFYNSSSSKPEKSSTNSANKKSDNSADLNLYAKAPQGAQPPNMLGSPGAAVIVEEFADFQCPTCAVVHPRMKEINALYGSRIKFIYRNFPITQIHKNAYDAALAAEAAGFQGKFWAMQEQLFSNQTSWSNASDARQIFEGYAQKIGLDLPKFQTDMVAITTKQRIDNDIQRARALGVNGTPTLYINGRQVAFEQMDVGAMRQIIDGELQKASAQSPTTVPANQTSNQTSTESK